MVSEVVNTDGAASSIVGLHVSGNEIMNAAGQSVRLLGVDRSGTEYACIQAWGMFDGPNDQSSITSLASWQVTAVRVPLNEDCWLGINGVSTSFGGTAYRTAITDYVNLLTQNGIAVILDLHWNAPGTLQATGQQQVPDADHAPAFWQSVATTFKTNSSVLFDLYNEPHDVSWTCWRDGGTCAGVSYQVAGMQVLVNVVRGTGASNVILLGGLAWSNDLSQWLQYEPVDSLGNLAASWHSYNFNSCSSLSCWDSQLQPVIQQVPLVVGEIGENDCTGAYITPLMTWLDNHGSSYLAWSWNLSSCSGGPSLITSWSGTPTTFGASYRQHLSMVGSASPPATATNTPTTTSTAVPSATAVPGSAAFDFEDGTTQGWGLQWGSETVRSSTTQAYSGSHSLGILMTGSDYPGISTATGLGGLASGSQVTYHVYVSSGGIGVTPYACDGNGTTHTAQGVGLAGGWTTVTWTIPSMIGVRCIGLQVSDSSNWTGEVDLDAVQLGSTTDGRLPTSTPIPPTSTPMPPTNTPVPTTSTPIPTATRTAVPSATNTAIPTNTPTGTTQLITNGGFESGQTPWTEKSAAGHQLITTGITHTGSSSARLCGYTTCNDSIGQTVTVPTSYASLSLTFWLNETTPTSTCSGALWLLLRTAGGTTIAMPFVRCSSSATAGWLQQTVTLTSLLRSYAGQKVQVVFSGPSGGSTHYFIDDVALSSH